MPIELTLDAKATLEMPSSAAMDSVLKDMAALALCTSYDGLGQHEDCSSLAASTYML